MEKDYKKIFLASNSAEGFVSYFKESYDFRDGWHAYIIKGGAGTGKSTFMKKVAAAASSAGFEPVLCFCSSDPDSLDGVIIEEIKTVLLDGTPPHTVEPSAYGVCEQIINLGQYLDCGYLSQNAEKIVSLFDINAYFHKTAARYLAALYQIKNDSLAIAAQSINKRKLDGYTKRLTSRFFKAKRSAACGKRVNRFLSGITPEGMVNFTDTVKNHYRNVFVIEDKYGAASSIIMQGILTAAVLSGYKTEVYKNPFLPSDIIDHVVIPELSLAFVSENAYIKFDLPVRRIRAERFYNADILKKKRNRIFFNRRLEKSLLSCAFQNLKNAKKTHDKIEKYYKNSADFEKIDKITDDFIKKIIKND